MKKSLFIFSFLILSLGSLHFISFTTTASTEALQHVQQQFYTGLDGLTLAIDQYQRVAKSFAQKESSLEALQTAHLATRLAFKEVEYLLEYYDHGSVKRHLNGPPLPSVEPKVPEVIEIQPVGLQVLDEHVFGDDPTADIQDILELLEGLEKDFQNIYNYQKRIHLDHRHIFEASREELVRIFTLGVTGFDTPGSGHALPEARQAIKSLEKALSSYFDLLAIDQPELVTEVQQLFVEAAEVLQGDFNDFDRLTFLKQYINPLYARTYQMHRALNIETVEETNPQPQATNYHAQNIFDQDFLNKEFYANIDYDHPLADQRIELGRLLFFDPILSSDNRRSCASCHDPAKAFTDGLPKSLAANGSGHIKRNSPTLINAVYAERYFYDLREPNLERQIKHVIMDSLEFATDFFTIIEKLQQSQGYQDLFTTAYPEFPSYQLSKWSISDALASYVGSLTAFNSPFDRYVRDEIEDISPEVKRGFNLFMGKATCGTCHFAPTFSGTVPPHYDESESEILGVPAIADTVDTYVDEDWGRYASYRPIDQAPFYIFSFKTTTVRNVGHTAPYMHNGVYQSLEEVIDFYNRGGGVGLGFDLPYQTLPPNELELTAQETQDLVQFMEALNEDVSVYKIPESLPAFEQKPEWNQRVIGGEY